jgi:hypothetical protein
VSAPFSSFGISTTILYAFVLSLLVGKSLVMRISTVCYIHRLAIGESPNDAAYHLATTSTDLERGVSTRCDNRDDRMAIVSSWT